MPLFPFVAGQDLSADDLNTSFDITRTAYQSSDQTISNSTTYLSSTSLVLPLVASASYIYESLIIYASDTTADFKHKLVLPSGSTVRIAWWASPTTGTTVDAVIYHDANTAVEFTAGAVGTGTPMSARPTGLITTSGAAGNLTVQYAQGSPVVSTTVLKTGSWIRVTRVA